MAKYKAVLFDNDGTIADTYDLILDSFRHATREVLGQQLPDDVLMARVGVPLAEQMKDFSDDPVVQEELLITYRTYNHKIHDERIALFPGELDALKCLSDAGLRMGVVTSKLHWLAQRGLEVLGISEYMEAFVGADDCPKFKPLPDPILMGCEQLDVAPEKCVYAGDSPFDIAAGNAAGCMTVAVTWGVFSEEALLKEKPDYVVSSFEELTNVLI